MKTLKIAVIVMMGMSLGVNAQIQENETLSLRHNSSGVGDIISLYGNRFNQNKMYGFGIESNGGILYNKSITGYNWYLNTNADNGSSAVMKLNTDGLIINKEIRANGTLSLRNNSSGLGDIISLYGNRFGSPNMYGFGVETGGGYLYSKAVSGYNWYIKNNADNASSAMMKLKSNQLSINGSIKLDNLSSGHTNIQIGHDVNDRIIADNSSNKYYGGGMFFRVTPDPSLNIQHNYIDVMMLNDKGKVGIGTRTMGNHRLAVEGSIGAREIKVETSGWSDFVFENDYNLPTLIEVENHIKENGHLKDIPSAKEVEKNGFFLGEMDAKLLQKIEELTLYTIAQEKKIKALEMEKADNKKQQKEIEEQRNKIERLEFLVQKLLKDKN